MMKRLVTAVFAVGFAFHVGACADDEGQTDPELTAGEVAALPDTLDPAHLDLPELTLAPDDGQAFDDDDAIEGVDQPVNDDDDASDDDPNAPAILYSAPLLKWGLHPRASDALRSIGVTSGRIMQTIGNAAASAGTHAQDGSVNGAPYSAATDISVSGLTNTQIRNLLEKLGKVGFAAWYRWPGHDGWPSSEVKHIHAVYANCKMKTSLRSQVRSWLAGRNGLVSNTIYTFHTFSTAAKAAVRHKFGQSASGTTNSGSSCFVGGAYCGGDKLSGNSNWLYRCTGAGAPTLIKKCSHGCRVNAGADDSCK